MEEYKELIRKAAKTRKRLKIMTIFLMVYLPIIITIISVLFMMHEEPTNLNIFMLCMMWVALGISMVTLYKHYKEL